MRMKLILISEFSGAIANIYSPERFQSLIRKNLSSEKILFEGTRWVSFKFPLEKLDTGSMRG